MTKSTKYKSSNTKILQCKRRTIISQVSSPLTTSGLETERGYSQKNDEEKIKNIYKQNKKDSSYKKQKEASDKVN